jgi:arylsulfatase A-like enzyme
MLGQFQGAPLLNSPSERIRACLVAVAAVIAIAASSHAGGEAVAPAASAETFGAAAHGAGAVPGRRPNILLMTLESLRPDHVGAYGGRSRSRGDLPLTPALDALAKESVVYENAYSVTSWTLASHASLFTGLYPTAHQTRHSTDRLSDSYATIAERLAAAGYDTAGVVSGPYLRRAHGLAQGFAQWNDEIAAGSQAEAHSATTNPRMLAGLRQSLASELDPAKPWFLFSYWWDPHYDYLPPAPYDAMYRGEDCEPIDVRDYETTDTVHAGIRPGELQYVLSQYAGEIRWTDEHLAELFRTLKERGAWDDTTIIVTADHGEEFFDHGEKGHKRNVYDESVRVPLIVKYPKGGPVGRDARLVSLVDILPTALELARVPVEGPVEGRSLLAAADPSRAIFLELLAVWRQVPDGFLSKIGTLLGRTPEARSYQNWYGVRRGALKLIVAPELGARRLFHLDEDAAEQRDLAREKPDELVSLFETLVAWQARQKAIAAGFEEGGDAKLTEQETEHLRSLGYVE